MKNNKLASRLGYNQLFVCCTPSPEIQQSCVYDTIAVERDESISRKREDGIDEELMQRLTDITDKLSFGDIFSRYQMLYSHLVKKKARKDIFLQHLENLERIYFKWDRSKISEENTKQILHLLVQYENMACA